MVVLFAQSLDSGFFWPIVVLLILLVLWLISWLLMSRDTGPSLNDLAYLDGMDRRMAKRLRAYGICNDRDLVKVAPALQKEIEGQLGLPDGQYASWRRQILSRWRESYLPSPLRNCDAIYPDPELGGLYWKRPERVDDLTKLDGIDSAMANRLNATGIYTFEQLRLLTPEQRANLKNRFNLAGFDFGRVPLSGVTAASLASVTAGDVGSPVGVPNRGSGSDRIYEAGLVEDSVKNRSGTSGAVPPSGRVEMDIETRRPTSGTPSSQAGDAGLVGSAGARAASDAGAEIPKSRIDAELGRVYTSPPPHRDDLTKLEGIDAGLAAQLNENGIYTVDQLLSLSPTQQATLKRRFDTPHLNFGRWRGRPAGRIDPGPADSGARGSSFQADVPATPTTTGDDDRSRMDVGYVHVSPPHRKDELTRLQGIRPDVERKLNLAGIYTFSQLKNMTPEQQSNFKMRFDLPEVDFGTWSRTITALGAGVAGVAGAAGAAAAASGISNAPTVSKSSSARLEEDASPSSSGAESGTAGSSAGAVTPSESGAASSGRVGFAAGVGSAPASSAASSGKPQVELPTKLHPTFGPVYASAPTSRRDELTRLKGIDAEAQSRLNAAGIYTFTQLRSLTAEQRTAVEQQLVLKPVDYSDWRRCINAWSRGIETTAAEERDYPTGWLHGIRLPEVAKGVFDGQQLVAYPEQVIFRGSDPSSWGTAIEGPQDGVDCAVPVDSIRHDINYVRIRRTDTRESVVAAVTKGLLFAPGFTELSGWNGLCEEFFGGRHLGIYAKDVPQEVETKFGVGGWGFGHRFDHNDQQEWAWNGRLVEPTTFEISVGHIGPPVGTVIFRSDDPTIWNTQTREHENRFAQPVDSVSHSVSFVRLVRVGTGEAIIVRVDRAGLLRRGENPNLGWNGLNDEFLGGRHLGVYKNDAPQEVEICYGEGGWGFGHPFDENNRQTWGWGGHAIGSPTVFEISVLENLPDHLRHELVE